MNKLLLIIPLLIFVSCDEIKNLIFSEDNEDDNFTTFPLPTEFPLDREYAWKYEYVSYEGIHELTNASDEGTTYFDTLHVFPNAGHGDAWYWWSSYTRFETPYRHLVMNEGDNFIHIANYYIEDDTSVFFEKPDLWVNYSTIFDASQLSQFFNLRYPNRRTSIDTINDTIFNSYIVSNEYLDGDGTFRYEFYINVFGVEKGMYSGDYADDQEDYLVILNKLGEIDIPLREVPSIDFDKTMIFNNTSIKDNKLNNYLHGFIVPYKKRYRN